MAEVVGVRSPTRWSPDWALVAVCLAVGVVALNTTAIGVATRGIADDLGASMAAVSWIVAVYLLAAASFALIGGRLGDVIGRARTFELGVVVFALGCLLAAIAPGVPLLVAGRAVQGVGAGLLIPASIELVVAFCRAGRPSSGLGMRSIVYASAFGVGPLVGGVLTDHASWRWIFWLELGLLAMAAAVALPLLKLSSGLPHPPTRDFRGAALVAVTVLAVVGTAFRVRVWGVWSWQMALAVLTVAALVGLLGRVEGRARHPLVHPSVLRDRVVLGANVATLAASIAMIGLVYFFVVFAESAAMFDTDAVALAAALLPFTLSIVAFSHLAALLRRRLGYRGPVLAGMGLAIAGFAWLSTVTVDTTEARVLVPLTLVGIGAGVANGGITGPAVLTEPRVRLDEAAGLVSLTRFIGSALAVAIGTSTYLTVAAHLPPDAMAASGGSPTRVALGTSAYEQAVATLRQDLRAPFEAAARAQTVEAFTTTMRVTAVVLAVLVALAAWLLRPRRRASP